MKGEIKVEDATWQKQFTELGDMLVLAQGVHLQYRERLYEFVGKQNKYLIKRDLKIIFTNDQYFNNIIMIDYNPTGKEIFS